MMRFNFVKELLSGAGTISSKRASGVFLLIIAMGCTVYLTITEGGSDVVSDLLQTAMFIAAGLLGITSITGIWKQKDKGNPNKCDPNKKDKI